MIVYDEERARKFMRNGYRSGEVNKHSDIDPGCQSININGARELEHKQNGGHGIQVAVEHNLVVHDLTEELAEVAPNGDATDYSGNISSQGIVHVDTNFNSNDGKSSNKGDNFSLPNSYVDHVTDSGAPLVSDRVVNEHTTILPDVHNKKKQKQRPPKPKRSQHSIYNNTRALLNETGSNFSSSGENNTSVDEDPAPVTDDSYKKKLESYTASMRRRHSYSTGDDTEHRIQHTSLSCGPSEDNLLYSPSYIHSDKNNANHARGLQNSGFIESLEDVKAL